MTGIVIYMEGGGDGAGGRQALRQGMDTFLRGLKSAVRAKARRWKLVCCGGRNEAIRAFRREYATGEWTIVALLVDAEGPVGAGACAHLAARDGWEMDDFSDDIVHLMVQAMETWIVADVEALARFYGQGFRRKSLPSTQDLETVPKVDIHIALERATSKTKTKGAYQKIRHASELLALLNPQVVRQRCPSCERMFSSLSHAIETRM